MPTVTKTIINPVPPEKAAQLLGEMEAQFRDPETFLSRRTG